MNDTILGEGGSRPLVTQNIYRRIPWVQEMLAVRLVMLVIKSNERWRVHGARFLSFVGGRMFSDVFLMILWS